LLVTSMHMTLLGALLSVSNRVWVSHDGGDAGLWDQQLGGIVMLGIGGLAYLTGALLLLGRALQEPGSGVRP
jgi:putative membrane protein